MKGSDIDQDARMLLADDDKTRWTDADFFVALNAAVRDVVTHKPKASTSTTLITLEANKHRQASPDGVVAVLDLLSNMGADGNTPGRGISPVERDRLVASVPAWRTDKAREIRHWWPDDREASGFWVWPAPNAALKVEALVAVQPDDIASMDDDLGIDDSYRNQVTHNTLSRLYARDSADAHNLALAEFHMQAYAQLMGIQIQKQKRNTAGANSPVNPAYPVVEKNGT